MRAPRRTSDWLTFIFLLLIPCGSLLAQDISDELDPIGNLPAGDSITIEFEVTVDSPLAAGIEQACNQGTISGTNFSNVLTDDPNNAMGMADITCAPIDAAPDLSITKSDGDSTVSPGDTYSYTLTYSNVGNQDATGVVLTEMVPANTTSGTNAGWVVMGTMTACNGQAAGTVCTFAHGALAAGGAAQMATFQLVVDDPVPAGVTEISNTATIADDGANGADPVAGNNTAMDTTPLDAAPDMEMVSKDDGGVTAMPGGTVTYTLTYQNSGDQGATGVFLTETVPANTTSGTNAGWVVMGTMTACDGQAAGTVCTFDVGNVAAGAAAAMATFSVVVDDPLPSGVTQISNTARVDDDGANGTDPDTANNEASDTTPIAAMPDLTLTKTDGGITVVPGQTYSFTLTYDNVGDQDATGVVITETVPTGTTSGTNAGWVVMGTATACDGQAAGTVCTFDVGAVAASAAAAMVTFQIVVDIPLAAGIDQVDNTASIADDGANGADPTPADNTAMDATPVTAAPDLSVTKVDEGTVPQPGDTLTYTISYGNAGSQGATGVVITETVPTATTSGTNPGWVVMGTMMACDGQPAGTVCTFDAGALPAGGATGPVLFVVVLDDPIAPGTTELSNTVSIADDGANGADENPADNTFTLETILDSTPPQVTLLNSVPDTGDGMLEECEQVEISLHTLLVTFDEPMFNPAGHTDPDDVTNPANYLLAAAGPDGDLSTVSCAGGIAGDDVAIPIAAVAYAAGTDTASLDLGGDLGDGPYRFFACGSSTLTDNAGNPLDGDGDGTGGDDFMVTFRQDAENFFVNGHFDCDLGSWTILTTVPGAVNYSADDVDGALISGSAEADNPIATGMAEGFSADQCAPVAGAVPHDLGARARVAAAPGIFVGATAECELFDQPACAGASLGTLGQTVAVPDTAGAWTDLSLEIVPPAGSQSARCTFAFDSPDGDIFVGNFDSLSLASPVIFADGFESGGVTGWVTCIGPGCPAPDPPPDPPPAGNAGAVDGETGGAR